jgi:HK97 family phage major capsid protein
VATRVPGGPSRCWTDFPLASINSPAINETSRQDGSRWGGALSYWAGEAASISSTLPRWRRVEYSAKKLISLVYVTRELLADAALLEGHVKRVYSLESAWKLDYAILFGTGTGTPLGVVNAPATISVAKESTQASGTILKENIVNMWKQLPAPSRRKAIWIVSEDAEGQFDAFDLTNTQAGFWWPAGWNGSSWPLLKGRPAITVEQAAALGSVGDVTLADLDFYTIIDGGMRTAISVDAAFISDQVVLRFITRIDGRPTISEAVTSYRGSTTRSPFVTLALRS